MEVDVWSKIRKILGTITDFLLFGRKKKLWKKAHDPLRK